MKKNTKKLFFLVLMLGGSISLFSQVRPAKTDLKETDVRKLTELRDELKKEGENRQAEILRLSEINNWPLIIKGEDGKISKLTHLSKDKKTPLYTTTFNAGSAITSRTNHLQPGGSLGLNLTGEFSADEAMSAGVWDGGHALANHFDLSGRVLVSDVTPSYEYHATHVTGTIIGAGIGAAAAKGMAPKAMVYAYNYDFDDTEMTDYSLIGGILSNHSYGLDQASIPPSQLPALLGSYIDISRGVDRIMFDAPYYQPVFAAGNDGDGVTYDRLTDRAVSKNGIAVAAVYQVDEYTGPASVQITDFSSFGPTNDNRIKPDIATKGFQVYSSTNASVSSHGFDQGTSMACPGITGTLLLLQQYYSILHPSSTDARNFMRSATLRGLMAHSADEAGNDPGPDPIYGWGLMNAKRSAEILAADAANTTAEIEELVLLPGTTYTKSVIALGTEPLIATLSWTDPAGPETGNVSTSVLVNNLDIKLTKSGTDYLPWRLISGGGQVAEKGVNNADNIEKVEIEGAAGVYTLTISHKKATLQNPNGAPQQAYSLILSGITATGGVDDIKDTAMFSVWPNPAQNELNVSFATGVEKGANVTIYDIQGRLVLTSALTAVDNVIDVQDLAKGIYMVTVINGEKSEIKKVVIK